MYGKNIDLLVNSVNIPDSDRVKFSSMFRCIAGKRLSECADFNGILRKNGIVVNGSDIELTKEIYMNCLILMSDLDGEVNVSNDRASLLAKKSGSVPKVLDRDTVSDWFVGSIGLVGDEDESATVEDDEDENQWGNWGSDDEYEDDTSELDDNEDTAGYSQNDDEAKEAEEESSVLSKEDSDSIKQYYFQFYKGIVSELAKRYSSLFESGYEITKPAGVVSESGLIGLSGNQRVITKFNISIKNIYNIFKESLDFIEVPVRSNIKIADRIYDAYSSGESRLLYFPNKMLEYAYGRKAPSGDNKDSLNTYENHSESANWKSYCKAEVEKSLLSVVGSSVVKFIYLSAKYGDYFTDELAVALQNYLIYLQKCLSLCVIMIDYKSKTKGISEDVFAFKVRVCDPSNMIHSDLTSTIINKAFMGSTGDVPFSYKPRIEEDTFVKEYAHEFNHDSSQAMPLFAYKAYLALQNQGIEPTWNNMILGMFEDGTILKNGSHGVSLESRLTHQDDAGSRAGKGVKTLNMLASAIYSHKLIFYLDRKPDMASMLKSISPDMFVLNGGGYDAQYDTYGQFTGCDSSINVGNIPNYVLSLLGTGCTWSELGDLFYMRALKLVVGIIVARGSGKFNDENFGGEEGILLVADEFKNFQESYSSIIDRMLSKVPPSSYLVDSGKLDNDKLKPYEKAKLMRDFSLSYNNESMYAITYLNSMVSDLEFLSTKRDAGFNQREIELSDIFVIGQHLNHGALDFRLFRSLIDDSSSSGRYKSSGKTGISSNASSILSKLDMQTASFPYSIVSFKTSDAFFGRNMEDGRSVYLAQTNTASKAYGRLDDKASNFAYLDTFNDDVRRRIVGGNVKDNIDIAGKCTYFKPFLVLNDAKQGDIYTEGMFARCAGAGNVAGQEWVSREEIISENPNSDGTFVNEAVGFEGYLKLMGITDYSDRLAKSSEIANYVVQNCLGYSGTWFDFITDLRPEWCFTIKDIVDGADGKTPDLANVSSNPVISEFVRFNPSLFGLDSRMVDDDLDDFANDGDISVADFMSDETYTDYSDMDMQEAKVEVEMDEVFGEDEVADEVDSGDEIGDDELLNLFDDNFYTVVKDDIQETGYSEDEEDVLRESGSTEAEIQELLKRLESLGVDTSSIGNVYTRDYEGDVNYGSRPYRKVNKGFEYFNSADETEFDERVEYDGGVECLADFVNLITNDVIKKFGGFERIVSFKVIGGSIVVNGYHYRCKAGDIFARNIPYDVRREINSGNISNLFDYSKLRYMNRLRDLEFDSTTFVYDYVSTALGYGSQISVDLFFRDFRALQCLCIGRKLFKRDTYMQQIANDDTFYHPKVYTKFANYSEQLLGNFSKNSWEFTKNTMKSNKYGKVTKFLGVTGGTAATVVTGTSKVAIKGGRKLSKGIRSLGSTLMELVDEAKKY